MHTQVSVDEWGWNGDRAGGPGCEVASAGPQCDVTSIPEAGPANIATCFAFYLPEPPLTDRHRTFLYQLTPRVESTLAPPYPNLHGILEQRSGLLSTASTGVFRLDSPSVCDAIIGSLQTWERATQSSSSRRASSNCPKNVIFLRMILTGPRFVSLSLSAPSQGCEACRATSLCQHRPTNCGSSFGSCPSLQKMSLACFPRQIFGGPVIMRSRTWRRSYWQ